MSKMKLAHNLSKIYERPRACDLEPGHLFVRDLPGTTLNNRTVYMAINEAEIAYLKIKYAYAVSLKSGFICKLRNDVAVVEVAGTLDVRREET